MIESNKATAYEETRIVPEGRGLSARLFSLSRSRYMLWNLIKSSMLLPYADYSLGIFWTIVRPLIFVSVIVFIRHKSNALMGEMVPYFLYVFSGVILWWYFTDAAKQSARSLYKYRGLITKVYFPRLVIPVVPVIARLFDLMLQVVVIIPLMFVFSCFPDKHLLLFPLVILQVVVLTLGLGLLFSVLSAAVKDFERVLDFTLYLAFFLSPVIFSMRIIPPHLQLVWAFLNPMSGPLEVMRAALFAGVEIDYTVWGLSILSTLLISVIGVRIFLCYEEQLAELIS
jgi:lipopolysaccharide transport system permease protein